MNDELQKAYDKLLTIREREDLHLRKTKNLRTEITLPDGSTRPLDVRYYQVQGILHLIVMSRFILGDDCGLGKTLECITALCFLWDSDPNQKVIVVTDKSAVLQWASEFDKFTTGVTVFPYMGGPKDRAKIREAFQAHVGPAVLTMNYAKVRQDFSALQTWQDYVLIFDECQAFKSPESQTHQVCGYLAHRSKRTWGLTATLIMNRLMEGFGILRVIVPGLFGNKNDFMYTYSVVEMVHVGRNRKVPRVVRHEPIHIKMFKDKIDPYHFGRAKWEVAKELPTLTVKSVEVRLSNLQDSKYQEALDGLLEVDSGDVKEVTKFTQIIYCQQIVNDPTLVDIDGESPKLETLIDLLTTGEFADEKVIVSTRFRKMVDRIEIALHAKGVPVVRVTGSEDDQQRNANMIQFQDPNSGVNVICITDAGKQAINLQAAKAIIFYDTDFSGGVFLQKLGRMIRIGSEHDKVYAVHLVARRKGGGKTIDHRCMEILSKKMGLIEAVLGKRIKGEGDEAYLNSDVIEMDNPIGELFDILKEDARGDETK